MANNCGDKIETESIHSTNTDKTEDGTDGNKHLDDISKFKNLAKHSVDIAYMLSTVNQLRHALELAAPWPRDFLIVLLSLSFVLQVAASALLLTESIMCRKDDYCNRKRYNVAIGVLMIVIIAINVLTTVFGGP